MKQHLHVIKIYVWHAQAVEPIELLSERLTLKYLQVYS